MWSATSSSTFVFFFQAEDGIRDKLVTGVQTWLFRSGQRQCRGSGRIFGRGDEVDRRGGGRGWHEQEEEEEPHQRSGSSHRRHLAGLTRRSGPVISPVALTSPVGEMNGSVPARAPTPAPSARRNASASRVMGASRLRARELVIMPQVNCEGCARPGER